MENKWHYLIHSTRFGSSILEKGAIVSGKEAGIRINNCAHYTYTYSDLDYNGDWTWDNGYPILIVIDPKDN